MRQKPPVFVDLDGVIRHNNFSIGTGDIPREYRTREKITELYYAGQLPRMYYILNARDIRYIDGALTALHILELNQFPVFVITNQEAIGLGLLDIQTWYDMMNIMGNDIRAKGGAIKGWAECPHFPDQACDCRKPSPKMIFQLAELFQVDPTEGYIIGDMPTDIEAGERAGIAKTIHILHKDVDDYYTASNASYKVSSLLKAVQIIISGQN